ncbi:MAG: 50S ribosomal protein L9 [Desulfocapsa sp.]|nr:MAG: 50S ribosomal protein L9 [Desulfocapsa sp.]
MEVILKETIDTLGREGDIVTVKPGFGRNYLLPQQKAVFATPANIEAVEKNKAEIEARLKAELGAAEALAKKLTGTTITIAMLTSDDERLFGSVTEVDIIKKLVDDTSVELQKKQIFLAEPIKALGESVVSCKLGYETSVDITVQVVPLKETEEA